MYLVPVQLDLQGLQDLQELESQDLPGRLAPLAPWDYKVILDLWDQVDLSGYEDQQVLLVLLVPLELPGQLVLV